MTQIVKVLPQGPAKWTWLTGRLVQFTTGKRCNNPPDATEPIPTCLRPRPHRACCSAAQHSTKNGKFSIICTVVDSDALCVNTPPWQQLVPFLALHHTDKMWRLALCVNERFLTNWRSSQVQGGSATEPIFVRFWAFFSVSSSQGHRKPVRSGLCFLIPGGESPQGVLLGSVKAAMYVLSCWQLGVHHTPGLTVFRVWCMWVLGAVKSCLYLLSGKLAPLTNAPILAGAKS